MLKFIICILTSYIAGSASPAALFARIKKTDLRKNGTGNLGATNAMLVLGRSYGIVVMVFDMAKGFFSVCLGKVVCPFVSYAGIASGCAAVIGHIFPFYLGFRGGKGLAPYAGMILALDPFLFLFLLFLCLGLMLITDHSVTMPYTAAVLFPVLCAVSGKGMVYTFVAAAIGAVIMIRHFGNLLDAFSNRDTRIRRYIKNMFQKK